MAPPPLRLVLLLPLSLPLHLVPLVPLAQVMRMVQSRYHIRHSKKSWKQDWLTSEVISFLEQYYPKTINNANEDVNMEDPEAAFNRAFGGPFESRLKWENSYQLSQAINHLGDMYGFTTHVSGMKIFCACGQSHRQQKVAKQAHDFGFNDPHDQKKRKANPVSALMCPFEINSSFIKKPSKGDGIPRESREVRVTSMNINHNHRLNKKSLIKAKKVTHKYAITPQVGAKLVEMMDSSPLPI